MNWLPALLILLGLLAFPLCVIAIVALAGSMLVVTGLSTNGEADEDTNPAEEQNKNK